MLKQTVFSRRLGLTAAAVVAVLATGCASNVKLADTPVETRNPTAAETAQPQQAQSSVATVDLAAQKNAELLAAAQKGRVIYFDFDSFVVKDEFRPAVEANAKYLANNKKAQMIIEGHTDERGGREYNLALGQKRAEAVVRALKVYGVTDKQAEPVSFGKEKPAVVGSTEAAYAKNRRVEFNYR